MAPDVAPEFLYPATVDVAYVQRVLDALAAIEVEGARAVARDRHLGLALDRALAAVYSGPELARVLRAWEGQAVAGFPDLADAPTPVRTRVTEVLRADPTCVIVAAERDFSGFTRAGDALQANHLGLVPRTATPPEQENTTPWLINYDRSPTAEDPCA